MNIKVVTAGNCMMCGREIKMVTKKRNDIFPNVLFCTKCEKLIEKEHAESQRSDKT